MMGDWAAALEATELAVALRNSVWSYPLVNAAHILGVALLVGSIVPLDLRLIGVWPSVEPAPLWRVLTRTAGFGFVLAVTFGALLFVTRATDYIDSNLFFAKMIAVSIGAANVFAVRMPAPPQISSKEWKPPSIFRFAGAISLAAWLTALVLGRLVGYF